MLTGSALQRKVAAHRTVPVHLSGRLRSLPQVLPATGRASIRRRACGVRHGSRVPHPPESFAVRANPPGEAMVRPVGLAPCAGRKRGRQGERRSGADGEDRDSASRADRSMSVCAIRRGQGAAGWAQRCAPPGCVRHSRARDAVSARRGAPRAMRSPIAAAAYPAAYVPYRTERVSPPR